MCTMLLWCLDTDILSTETLDPQPILAQEMLWRAMAIAKEN